VLHATTLGPDEGPGSWVVFCHGLFGQGKNWTQVAKVVARRHRVLLLDMPQHGRSPWSDDFDYLEAADQVAAAVFEHAGDEPAALVGHSMGGKIAMVLALRHPARVARLCVVDVAPASYDSMREFPRYVEAMRSLDLGALASRSEAESALAPAVPDPVVRGFLLQNLRRHHDATREGPGWFWQPNLEVIGARLDVITGWPAEKLAGLAPYDGPVLWVRGERSAYVGQEHAAAMTALFPRVRKVTVKGAGHWVHSEQPEAFAGVMRAFLGD
jgi:pimeloyl-ACP methyl ester carboxylesterase